jgi:transcriptional regulator with PAS, ATPase and Fis domain
MQGGRFREDLFYRIAVLAINTPPLRKRVSDIPLLVDHFLCEAEKRSKCSRKRKVEKEAMKVLANFPWPGNVRQLRHVVEKLVATTMDGDLITAEAARRALPNGHLSSARPEIPLLYHENDSLEAFLDRTLLTLYEQLLAKSGSHSQAARLLRIDRTSLYQRIERARRRVQGS